MKNDLLCLHEEIMLLALRDKEGTIQSGAMYQHAIGGAILAELLLGKFIAVEESKRSKLIDIVSSKSFGEPLIDECLEKIRQAKRRASLQTWVSRFANIKHLKHRVAEKLCARGILRADEDKVLLIFTRKIYPEANPKPEKLLTDRLYQAIFTDTMEVDPRTVVLVSLAHGADLLKGNFDKRRLKTRKERIDKLVKGEIIGKAAKEAIQAMQAAIMVAVIMPAVITTVCCN